jgi:hypothetical protein
MGVTAITKQRFYLATFNARADTGSVQAEVPAPTGYGQTSKEISCIFRMITSGGGSDGTRTRDLRRDRPTL